VDPSVVETALTVVPTVDITGRAWPGSGGDADRIEPERRRRRGGLEIAAGAGGTVDER